MATVHISFGPVQSYISQARTTRDLWSGSFLLSMLSRKALTSAVETGLVLQSIRPSLNTKQMQALRETSALSEKEQRIGLIPNFLELEVESSNIDSVGNSAVAGWYNYWNRVCVTTMKLIEDSGIKIESSFIDIWSRQVEDFWEDYWVEGEYQNLARRKSLRSFDKQPEEGFKCTVCGEREVLRGQSDILRHIRKFWMSMGKVISKAHIKDDGSERLCTICLIKRCAPQILEKIENFPVPPFPSTTSFSTVPWRLAILESDNDVLKKKFREYGETIRKARGIPIKGLWYKEHLDSMMSFEGNYFLLEQLDSKKIDHTEDELELLRTYLRNLRTAAREGGIEDPNPYYAVLSMDGDSLGALLSRNEESKIEISQKLSEFALTIPDIVEQSWGRVVYAGGDDVLVLLPIHTVLNVAQEIRTRYVSKMKELDLKQRATISAGIVLAHFSAPFGTIISRSHHLLDSVAKKHRIPVTKDSVHEKDAVVIEVWDRGGPGVCFVKNWENPQGMSSRYWIEELLDMVQRLHRSHEAPLTSSFLHSASKLLRGYHRPFDNERLPEDFIPLIRKLLLADYLRSRDKQIRSLKETDEGREKSNELMHRLIELSVQHVEGKPVFNPDHLHLILFLSRGGSP